MVFLKTYNASLGRFRIILNSSNSNIGDISIIPSQQKNDIYKYTNLEDRNKRFIAKKNID